MNYTIKNLDNCLSSFTEKKDVYQTVSPRKGFVPPRTAFSFGFRHLSAAAIAVEKPHFATVRPGFDYNYTKWYYNPNQDFRLDIRWIDSLR
ncbi:MAG: hypothetical protein FWG99_08140 [Treponema sp.]|nr:hypothetical protein [Treponema sp.]